jgi:hypothetical protein
MDKALGPYFPEQDLVLFGLSYEVSVEGLGIAASVLF